MPLTDKRRSVTFLDGPIGTGQTTLGRAPANEIDAEFIDDDELRDQSKSWIGEILTLSKCSCVPLWTRFRSIRL